MNEQLDLFKDVVSEVSRLTQKRPKHKNAYRSKKDQEEHELLDFKRILNQQPPPKLIKTNQQFGNKYIPLQVVEQMLLAIYDSYGIEQPFAPLYIEGQLIYFVNIVVTHPILKTRETYSGTASVPLIPASGPFKWNHRNVPGAESFAILNASKKIGQIFRAETDDYADIMRDHFEKKQEVPEEDKAKAHMKQRLLKMIASKKTVASLQKISDDCIGFLDGEVNNAYSKKHYELTMKEKKK